MHHTDQIPWPFLTCLSVAEKTGLCGEVFLAAGGCSAVVVAVVERFKLAPMYRLSAGQKKRRYCREVAVSGLVWLYNYTFHF